MRQINHAEIDLHGYTERSALELAAFSIREAWENGCQTITLIHGAPDVEHHFYTWMFGRGSIKWGLRGALSRGEYLQWCYNRRSVKHYIGAGSMTLALRPNPNPRLPQVWKPPPKREYGHRRR
jgi:hypothetical protein